MTDDKQKKAVIDRALKRIRERPTGMATDVDVTFGNALWAEVGSKMPEKRVYKRPF